MSRSVLFLTLFLSIHTFAGAKKGEWVLANPNEAAQPLVVYEGEDGNGDIAKVVPGKYKSFDGLEQSDLHVNLPSINFAPDCGAYNVVYQWDKKTKKFLKSETGD